MKWLKAEYVFPVLLIVLGIYAVFLLVTKDTKLEQAEQKYEEARAQNEELQKEKDELIAQYEKEKEEILKEKEEVLEKVSELEPLVENADLQNEKLRKEYGELIESGASTGRLLENALSRVKVLDSEVFILKKQLNGAYEALELSDKALKAQVKITEEWKQKYSAEVKLREISEDTYEACKSRVKVLKLRGTLATIGGLALGACAGLVLSK